MKRDDTIYLQHILNAVTDIEHSIKSLTIDTFKKNKDIVDATLRRIEVIGEAAKNVSPSFKKKYAYIKWRNITGTRDVLIHAYFSVDLDLVWEIVIKDLPKLKLELIALLKEENGNDL